MLQLGECSSNGRFAWMNEWACLVVCILLYEDNSIAKEIRLCNFVFQVGEYYWVNRQ